MPHLSIRVVDFGKMTIKEQIQMACQSDVLIGVHGAGFTHSMFLERGAAVVELVPREFNHKGFRNLAQAMDLTYFRTHAKAAPGISGIGDWQEDPIAVDQDQLVQIVCLQQFKACLVKVQGATISHRGKRGSAILAEKLDIIRVHVQLLQSHCQSLRLARGLAAMKRVMFAVELSRVWSRDVLRSL